MYKSIVRLSSLTLKHIKNVKNGTIIMPFANDKGLKMSGAEVLGIYGQNGSGKTAVIDILYYLQHIMVGESLEQSISDYIDVVEENAEIIAEYKICVDDIIFEVGYQIYLKRNDTGIVIDREQLNCAINQDGIRKNKIVFMDYQREDADSVFKPVIRLKELMGNDRSILMDLLVARKMAEKSNCSYIFGENSREIFINRADAKFSYYSTIISELFFYALKDLFVIRNTHSGMITANLVLPMTFRVGTTVKGIKGDFAIPLKEPVVLDKLKTELLHYIVEQINKVLYTIIPGMSVDIKDYGKMTLDTGEEGWRMELLSVRDGMKPIPIRMESEGIIKIISILNALILAFGNPSICLAIDELDAGIFEYLLGELLDVFSKSAKGQLIFTSHNLRALEMLPKESIVFSTVNPNNRYIRMKNVKETNNMRSMYIRSITLGGQDEKIYDETDSLKIAKAFRKAGRSLMDE